MAYDDQTTVKRSSTVLLNAVVKRKAFDHRLDNHLIVLMIDASEMLSCLMIHGLDEARGGGVRKICRAGYHPAEQQLKRTTAPAVFFQLWGLAFELTSWRGFIAPVRVVN